MRYSFAPLALAALAAATPVPQGVTEEIAPDAATPSGCQTSYDGTFNIQIVNVSDATTKRSIHKRQSQTLALTLADGILKDSEDRTGYIAANSQFQFDAPPQTGAIYTAGWSVCSNNRLTLGDDDRFFSCLSGDFYNLYDENVLDTDQCTPVYIDVVGTGSTGGAASVMPDGQPTGSAVASQIPDGQVTASAIAPISQIPDGQIQATTAVSPVQQISDGQIQNPTAPVQQISDGQIQAQPTTASAPIQQISDGQVQATSAVSPVSQIPDGQVQAPTGTGSVYPMPTANGTMAYPSLPVQQTGAAQPLRLGSGVGLAAGLFGFLVL